MVFLGPWAPPDPSGTAWGLQDPLQEAPLGGARDAAAGIRASPLHAPVTPAPATESNLAVW